MNNIEITPIFEENEIKTEAEFITVTLKKDQIVPWETFAYLRQIGLNVISLNMEKLEITFENKHKRFVYKGLNQ